MGKPKLHRNCPDTERTKDCGIEGCTIQKAYIKVKVASGNYIDSTIGWRGTGCKRYFADDPTRPTLEEIQAMLR